MASRKRKTVHATQLNLPIETIWWHDASRHEREKLELEPYILVSSGTLVFEDDIQIIMAYEVQMDEEWDQINDGLDYTKIPKISLLKRIRHGTIELILPDDVLQQYTDRVRQMGAGVNHVETIHRAEQPSTKVNNAVAPAV